MSFLYLWDNLRSRQIFEIQVIFPSKWHSQMWSLYTFFSHTRDIYEKLYIYIYQIFGEVPRTQVLKTVPPPRKVQSSEWDQLVNRIKIAHTLHSECNDDQLFLDHSSDSVPHVKLLQMALHVLAQSPLFFPIM